MAVSEILDGQDDTVIAIPMNPDVHVHFSTKW